MMKKRKIGRVFTFLPIFATLAIAVCAAQNSVEPPAGAVLLLTASGDGSQVYTCTDGHWMLKSPDAKLIDAEGRVIGAHFADTNDNRIRLLTPVGLPSINPGGTVNAASSAAGSPVAPGSIATVYGSFLVSSLSMASSSPLPVSLAGLSLQFGSGLTAPLFAVSSGQVNFQVPWELAGASQASLSAPSTARPV